MWVIFQATLNGRFLGLRSGSIGLYISYHGHKVFYCGSGRPGVLHEGGRGSLSTSIAECRVCDHWTVHSLSILFDLKLKGMF